MKRVAPLVSLLGAALLVVAVGPHAVAGSAQPALTLRVNKAMAFAPARIVLMGQVKGGSDSIEDLYCPSVEWDWGDDTHSASSGDCEPFEAGKSAISRFFVTEHVFKRGGNFTVRLTLKKHNRVVFAAETTLQISPGLGEDPDIIR
jgi:hypothetical protein